MSLWLHSGGCQFAVQCTYPTPSAHAYDLLCIRTGVAAGDPGEIATSVGLKSKESNSLPVVLCNRACAYDHIVAKIGCWRAHLTPLGCWSLKTA